MALQKPHDVSSIKDTIIHVCYEFVTNEQTDYEFVENLKLFIEGSLEEVLQLQETKEGILDEKEDLFLGHLVHLYHRSVFYVFLIKSNNINSFITYI